MLGERQTKRIRRISVAAMLAFGLAVCVPVAIDFARSGAFPVERTFDAWLFIAIAASSLAGGLYELRRLK